MSNLNVVRAWKDARYRRGLSAEELARLPENPAGPVELTDSELRNAGGFGGGDAAVPDTAFASLTRAFCCPASTAATCTSTFGGCCPDPL